MYEATCQPLRNQAAIGERCQTDDSLRMGEPVSAMPTPEEELSLQGRARDCLLLGASLGLQVSGHTGSRGATRLAYSSVLKHSLGSFKRIV